MSITLTREGDPAATELRFATAVTTLFALVLVITMIRHEMWRDELQAWMLARDSASLRDLFANTRAEGHTAIWFVLLFGLSRITRSPVAMQVVHVLLATSTVFLVAWRAPFPRLWRALIPFGYFFLYDYAVVSRTYAVGVFLLIAWCALRTARPDSLVLPALLLALLANTSAYGMLLAVAAFASMTLPVLLDYKRRERSIGRGLATSVVLMSLGLMMAVWWISWPRTFLLFGARGADAHSTSKAGPPPPAHATLPADQTTQAESGSSPNSLVVRLGTAAMRGLVPLPAMQIYPRLWQRNALTAQARFPLPRLAALLGAALLLAGVLLVRRNSAAMMLFGGFALLYMGFEAMAHRGSIYHNGHLWLALVASLWIAGGVSGRERLLVSGLLLAHVIGGMLMVASDLAAPFSGAKAAAAFIRQSGRANGTIVSARTSNASTVAGYLDHPIFYADLRIFGTFETRSDIAVRTPDPETSIIDEARRLAELAGGRPVTVLLQYPLYGWHENVALTPLAAFDGTMTDETMHVFDFQLRQRVWSSPSGIWSSDSVRGSSR